MLVPGGSVERHAGRHRALRPTEGPYRVHGGYFEDRRRAREAYMAGSWRAIEGRWSVHGVSMAGLWKAMP